MLFLKKKLVFFSFKQTEYIWDSKERLNYITELINYSNNINILEGDESIKLLSPMSFDPRQYQDLISMKTIGEIKIKNNYSQYKDIFENTLIRN